MEFCFDKAACLNIRRALRKEWLLTNGTGDYSSSTILCCNTRKYHGLLVANLDTPPGRHVLLSTTEESVLGGGKEFFFSTRKHPGVFFPHGHEYMEAMQVKDWPLFRYKVGDLTLTRELALVRGRTLLLAKYTVSCESTPPPLTLRIKPLLAYRDFHALTVANGDLQVRTFPVRHGFTIRPYDALPPLFMQTKGQAEFFSSPDWYRNIEYFVEEERGFPHQEDLFLPGVFDIALSLDAPVFVSASTEEVAEDLEALWEEETGRRRTLSHVADTMLGHFVRQGSHFMATPPRQSAPVILAGYHWFDAWGRDACIALPGLTFCAGRLTKGVRILEAVGETFRNGLLPNCFANAGDAHAYNSVDAALWYVWAVQKLLRHLPDHLDWVREQAWPHIKAVTTAYRDGVNPGIFMDDEGLLHAGDARTQLTWMDAQVDGRPVTPRHGCPVEINALWYNALAFAEFLGEKFDEPVWCDAEFLRRLRANFRRRFWINRRGGYLGDVWNNGRLDASIRPNQIFAVSLPYPVLEEDYQPFVVECLRNHLLTPYGIRTLSPDDPRYKAAYEGDPAQRDGAYHQGTVWPWLLGHYTEALLRTAWDTEGAAQGLLETVTPLFTDHLTDAGVGSISEIFDGSPPHTPDGCIAQAWSVAECLRLLRLLQMTAPKAYAAWEATLEERFRAPRQGDDTAGICRVTNLGC